MSLPGLVRYYGGKGNMLGKLLPLIPWSRIYVEPFGGAASVLMNLKPRPVEVYNDLDGEIVNLARVMQDPRTHRRLRYTLEHTLYSRAEFMRALEVRRSGCDDPVLRAWATFVACNQGFSGRAESQGDWGCAFVSVRGMAVTVSTWNRRVEALAAQHRRLRRVQIDSVDGLECIRYWDSPDTLFYCDPPYVPGSRAAGSRSVYAHEMTDEQHAELVRLLLEVEGGVVLSGYPSEVYAPLDAAGWERHKFETACHAAGRVRGSKLRGRDGAREHVPRTEAVWRNERAVEMAIGPSLFKGE